MKTEEKIILDGEFEEVLEKDGHYYIKSKKDRACVLPYTISSDGLLDTIGVIDIWNEEEQKSSLSLLHDYLNEDDQNNLAGANRILFQTLGINFAEAEKWMFLGSLINSIVSDSPIKLYCVDISNLSIDKITLETPDGKKFRLLDSSKVLQTDDTLFLASFSRLFNYFYAKSFNRD